MEIGQYNEMSKRKFQIAITGDTQASRPPRLPDLED